MHDRAIQYLELVKPTYIENWSTQLYSLSFAQVDIPLSLEEAKSIGLKISEFGDAFVDEDQLISPLDKTEKEIEIFGIKSTLPAEIPTISMANKEWLAKNDKLFNSIRDKVSQALIKFPNGAVVRLGSRSPKDSYGWQKTPRLVYGDDPFTYICDSSERMYEDLTLALKCNYAPHIFVREWKDIEPWAEFRCFINNRKLVGISQYNYFSYYKEIEDNLDSLIHWIPYYINDYFKPACKLENVIVDLASFIKTKTNPNGMTESIVEFKVIEINPFFEMTDPCLFAWNVAFDNTFRHIDRLKKIVSHKINRYEQI